MYEFNFQFSQINLCEISQMEESSNSRDLVQFGPIILLENYSQNFRVTVARIAYAPLERH